MIQHVFLSNGRGDVLAGLWLNFDRPLQLWGQRMDVNVLRRMTPQNIQRAYLRLSVFGSHPQEKASMIELCLEVSSMVIAQPFGE
jgi:hypothetical protein